MSTSAIIDCVLGAVVVLFAYLGWRRGFFRTLSELAAVVIALFLASQIANAAAPAVVDRFLRPAAQEAITGQLDAMWQAGMLDGRPLLEGVRDMLESIPNQYVRESALGVLEEGGLFTAVSYTKAAALDLGRQAVDAALDGPVRSLVRSVLYAVSFGLLLFLLRLAARTLNLTMKLPVLRQLNEACGLLVGAGKGIILDLLGVWVAWMAGALTAELVEGSLLLRLAAQCLGLAGGTPA